MNTVFSKTIPGFVQAGLTTLLFFISLSACSQVYYPEWESLDKHPVNDWYENARFGIRINWGVFSVPAYMPFEVDESGYIRKEGALSEAYVPDLLFGSEERSTWHRNTYGNEFTYFDFGDLFRAELFDPGDWSELLSESGARYVVLPAKSADAYTMWPATSKYSTGWNSGEKGPGVDFCAVLSEALREAGLKTGFYYSLREYWSTLPPNQRPGDQPQEGYYVPLSIWQKYHIPGKEYQGHIHSHIQELVKEYRPDLLWFDGEWDYPEEKLGMKSLLAGIYNENPDIVVNDRLARGTAGLHGDFQVIRDQDILDFQALKALSGKVWEKSVNISYSGAYNRGEGLVDYKDADELIEELVRVISAGGNFLLTIGPSADGRIPLVTEQRLRKIGAWMKKNGEAVYGSQAWKPFLPVKTVNPRAGSDIFFTQKGEDLYVFLLNWKINVVSLRETGVKKGAMAYHLGSGDPVEVKVKSGNVVIELPPERQEAVTVIRIESAFTVEEK